GGTAGTMVGHLASRGLLPHFLVNNARDLANLKLAPDGMPSHEQWAAEFMLGVVVPLELTVALASTPGSPLEAVVNIASIYGMVAANPGLYDNPLVESPIHYGTVKAALLHLTRE